MEQGVISGDKEGPAVWSQVLIVSKGTESWSWIVSLLGAVAMVVYITSPILRDDSVGRQDMQITHYDSIVDLIKDVANGLWDGGLSVLQGSCVFLVYSTTSFVMESPEINTLGVASGIYSKGLKMLRNYLLTSKISVSYCFQCDIEGVKKCA